RVTGARPRCARLFPLALHRILERGEIDGDAPRAQRILREIQGKAVGVIKREGGLAIEHGALLQACALFIENGKAALERAAEARFFELERFRNERLGTE